MSLRTVPAHPRVSIIVPTFNEAPNLERVLPTLPDVHEVIVVDGGSADGTVETAQRVMPSARVMQQTRTGKGNALAWRLRGRHRGHHRDVRRRRLGRRP